MKNNKNSAASKIDNALLDKSVDTQGNNKQFLILGAGFVFVVLIIFAMDSQEPIQQIPSLQTTAITPEENSSNRERFKKLLAEFDSNLQPLIENRDIIKWQESSVQKINDKKESAIASFAKGTYFLAIEQIEDSVSQAKSLLDKWQKAYEQQLNKAVVAFELEKIDVAEVELNKALSINSSDQQGIELQRKIKNSDFPEHFTENFFCPPPLNRILLQ